MYYDISRKEFVTAAQMRERGIPVGDPQFLAEYGFFMVDVERPEYNPEIQGLEPEGDPEPSEYEPYLYIQKMRVVNLLDEFKKQRLEELAALRWDRQALPVWVDGIEVSAGPDTQDRLQTAIQSMQANGMKETDFKADSGWVTLTLAQMIAIFSAAGRYTQACYANERALTEKIGAAATIPELNSIDLAQGWPETGRPEDIQVVVYRPEKEQANG